MGLMSYHCWSVDSPSKTIDSGALPRSQCFIGPNEVTGGMPLYCVEGRT